MPDVYTPTRNEGTERKPRFVEIRHGDKVFDNHVGPVEAVQAEELETWNG